jgi:hypothetical protein
MMKRYIYSMTVLCTLLGGCASVSGPDTAALGRLPVVAYGQPVPTDSDYILHFPAGVPIDTPVTFKGTLFERAVSETLTVKPATDIYVNKQWVSFDGEHWMQADKAIDTQVQVVLPGYAHPEPGYVLLEMNTLE